VRTSTVLLSLAIDSLATYIPFRLLRPLSLAHSASSTSSSVQVPNREIVTDSSVQTITTLLSASIYAVTLYISYLSFLPTTLVTYFNDIPTIAATHSSTPISLIPITLVLGLAARSFIFTPATALSPSLGDARRSAFNPATATLGETFFHNVWGFSPRTKAVIKRTALLAAVSGYNTFLQTYFTVEGVEAQGAVVYAGVWSFAAVATGLSLGVVGAV
jgi:hypothetical protein